MNQCFYEQCVRDQASLTYQHTLPCGCVQYDPLAWMCEEGYACADEFRHAYEDYTLAREYVGLIEYGDPARSREAIRESRRAYGRYQRARRAYRLHFQEGGELS